MLNVLPVCNGQLAHVQDAELSDNCSITCSIIPEVGANEAEPAPTQRSTHGGLMTEPTPEERLLKVLNTMTSGGGVVMTSRAEGGAEHSAKPQTGVEPTEMAEGGVALSMEPKGGTRLMA